MMNEKFMHAIETVKKNGKTVNGIGTYSESTLHAVLKNYYEPDSSRHELRMGKYVADIVGQEGIIEIQTHQLFRLKKKIRDFLSVSRVSVVFPVIKEKYVIWTDTDTGEIIEKRKSPKHENIFTAMSELYSLHEFIQNPDFRFIVPIISAEDYKYFKRNKYGKKTEIRRFNCIPVDLHEEKIFVCSEDYKKLIPEKLSEVFTSADFARETNVSKDVAASTLRLLYNIGAVTRIERDRNGWKYTETNLNQKSTLYNDDN